MNQLALNRNHLMTDRAYISNISPSWPVADQEKLLAERGFDPKAAHRDMLRARQLRSRDPEHLSDREALARSTGRVKGGTLHVATPAIMAWRVPDFRRLVEALAARFDAIMVHAEGRLFRLPEDIEALVQQFPISRTAAGRRAGSLVGAAASAATRNAISKAAADRIRDRWGTEGHTAAALCAEVDFTYHTMRRYLPRWEVAARRRERNGKRAAARQAEGASA